MIWEFAAQVGRRLLVWATLSMVAGTALLVLGDSWWRGFGIQALVWGAIDGAIGLAGLRGSRAGRLRAIGDPTAPRREARRLRRLLLLNAGLDIVYVSAGLVLAGPVAGGDAFLAGMGWGVVVQGAFLLVFDLVHALTVPDGSPIFPDGVELFAGPEHRAFRLEPAIATGKPGPAALLVHGYGGTPAELRSLADRLAGEGWTVEVPLLPGFGNEIRELPDRRADDWLAAVVGAVEGARAAGHSPLLFVGFSFGATLGIAAAARTRLDNLVLVAPFWLPDHRALRLLGPLVRPFLPTGVRPFRRLDLNAPDVRAGVTAFLPGLDLDDPSVAAAVSGLRVPLALPEQLVVASRWAAAAAPDLRLPVLGIVGTGDTVATPSRARRLLALLPGPARTLEVDAGHGLLRDASPVRERVEEAVIAFGAELLSGPSPAATIAVSAPAGVQP